VECDRIERIGHAPQRRHVTDRSIHGDAKRIRCVSDLAAEATAEFKRSSKTELNLGTLSSVLLAPPEQDVSPFGHSVNTAIGIDDDLITGRDYNPPISVRLSWLTPPNAIGAALLLERARLLVLKADYRDCARCLRRKARTTHLPRWTGNISFCITSRSRRHRPQLPRRWSGEIQLTNRPEAAGPLRNRRAQGFIGGTTPHVARGPSRGPRASERIQIPARGGLDLPRRPSSTIDVVGNSYPHRYGFDAPRGDRRVDPIMSGIRSRDAHRSRRSRRTRV